MEDYKIIIYIVLAILYFLFSGKKKKKEGPANQPPVAQKEDLKDKPVYQPRPTISQSKPVQKPVSQPTSSSDPEPYSLEDILKQFGQQMDVKEEAKTQELKEVKAETLEIPKGKIIDYDEDLAIEEDSLEKKSPSKKPSESVFGKDDHFTPYELEHESKNKYADMLKDPEGIKTAFIAGEIFNRKF